MYRRGLVGAFSGNTSLRLTGSGAEGLLLVTPTHFPYYRLEPEHLVVVDIDGVPVTDGQLQPSSETLLHLEIYRQRDDVWGSGAYAFDLRFGGIGGGTRHTPDN